jgi:hypothetical protein
LVIVAVASRSSSRTTSIRNAWRVGTSIWERRARTSKRPTAAPAVGANPMAMRSTFEARCENTMVLTRPNQRAARTASRTEHAVKSCAAANTEPIAAGVRAKCA